MAKAKKLPSGSYRAQVFDYTDAAGKRHYKSFTASTKKEAELQASQYMIDKEYIDRNKRKLTVKEGIDLYISSKIKSLSPTTITAYKSMQKNLFNPISDIYVTDLTSTSVQVWIGSLNSDHSPKSVKNAYGLLSAMVDTFYPDMRFKVKLPQKERNTVYVPSDSDVQTIISHYKQNDRDMYIACLLAAFGTLRRSEACALTASDVDGNTITVNKAMVREGTKDDSWVIKSTKNTSSTRRITMPEFVIKELPKEGNLISINPSRVSDRFIKTFKKLGKR